MRKMKDSGIEYIGFIPNSWKVIRIKDEYVFDTGFTPDTKHSEYYSDDKGHEWVTISDIVNGAIQHPTSSLISRDYVRMTHRRKVPKGSLLYSFKLSVGTTAIAEKNIFTNEAIASFYPMQSINIDFLRYSSTLIEFNGNTNIYGAIILNQKLINDAHVVFPPLKEQKIIADYLNSKCSEIDALSTDIQKEIETLEEYKKSVITEAVTKGLDKNVPMKDSGVKWIGNMPSHWDLQRGKYILNYLQKPVRPDDGVITCFRDGEVTLRSNRREEGFTMSDKEIGYQGIDVGDLVVHGMDGFAGSIGISDSRGKASPVLNVLDSTENKKYIMYYLRSMAFSDVFVALATGIRVRSCDLRWNKLAELFYPIPPKEEQDRIVKYIDDRLKQSDNVITMKQEQLAVLADYKKSLIYEYVTGKKEVPTE